MLYFRKIDNQIVEITDQIIDDFESVEVATLDEAIYKFNELELKYSEDIESRLEEIFAEREEVLDGFDIKVSTENRSFNELADMFQEKDIDIPDVQRKFPYSRYKKKELHNHIPEISIAAISLLIPTLYVLDDLEIISFDFPINPLVASSLCLIALLWVLTLKG